MQEEALGVLYWGSVEISSINLTKTAARTHHTEM